MPDDGGLDKAVRELAETKRTAEARAEAAAASRREAGGRLASAARAFVVRAQEVGLEATEWRWSETGSRSPVPEPPPPSASRKERRLWKLEVERIEALPAPAKTYVLRVWTLEHSTTYDRYSGQGGDPGYYVSEDGRVMTGSRDGVDNPDPQFADRLIQRMAQLLVR